MIWGYSCFDDHTLTHPYTHVPTHSKTSYFSDIIKKVLIRRGEILDTSTALIHLCIALDKRH